MQNEKSSNKNINSYSFLYSYESAFFKNFENAEHIILFGMFTFKIHLFLFNNNNNTCNNYSEVDIFSFDPRLLKINKAAAFSITIKQTFFYDCLLYCYWRPLSNSGVLVSVLRRKVKIYSLEKAHAEFVIS